MAMEMKKTDIFFILTLVAVVSSCGSHSLSVSSSDFGELSTGERTTLYTLTNSSGASMTLCDYGARIVSINVPDRNGDLTDVVVGYGDIASFEKGRERFMGCVIGRYANRINHSSFEIDGVRYEVVPNEKRDGVPVQCHGGPQGFDRFVWDGEMLEKPGMTGVRFTRLSPDGEQGYPGNLRCSVTYWWTEANVCRIEYEAVTDKPTVVNLSNHTVFNLKGPGDRYVMNHIMTVDSDVYVQGNRQLCPDKLLPVAGSPFDFREPHRVDYRIDDYSNEQFRIADGMSGCWVIRDWDGSLKKVADLYAPETGIGVETWSTEPAFLTFTGRTFDGSETGKYGPMEKFCGMLLETFHLADSPNRPEFPTTELRPDDKFTSVTEWHFYVE